MRKNIEKKKSTKAERIFYEILKKNHIPFKHRVVIEGREVDFLIDNIAIEIGDHSQDTLKNKRVIESGYNLLFITNKELYESPDKVEQHLKKNWTK
jgi:very-short-patch-repair endonuclease